MITRCIVPFGGLVRGRLKAGETVIVNGATGAYGSAAVLVALAMGAARVVAPVPINYMLIMFNSLEIIGNFMYQHDAYLPLLALLRSGPLDTSAIIPKVFSLTDLPQAMEYAATAQSLECVVVTARPA